VVKPSTVHSMRWPSVSCLSSQPAAALAGLFVFVGTDKSVVFVDGYALPGSGQIGSLRRSVTTHPVHPNRGRVGEPMNPTSWRSFAVIGAAHQIHAAPVSWGPLSCPVRIGVGVRETGGGTHRMSRDVMTAAQYLDASP
jgi:hypothetical protein